METTTYNLELELKNLDLTAAERVKEALHDILENAGLKNNILTLEIVKSNL